MLTFQRTTKTSNAMKYKMHILDMRISPCLLQPANSTELSILRGSPAILIMILVWSLFQLQWFLMKLLTVMVWHSQITTNWSSLHKKLIQLSIHFIFGSMDVPDNLGPLMYSTHFSTTQQTSSWLGTMVKPMILKVCLNCDEIVYYIEQVNT